MKSVRNVVIGIGGAAEKSMRLVLVVVFEAWENAPSSSVQRKLLEEQGSWLISSPLSHVD